MSDIVLMVIGNLEKVGIGFGLFMGAYLANMALGAWRNVKIEGYAFDWMKIAESGVKFLVLGLGIALLTIAVSAVPVYATYVGIEIATETIEFLDSVVIIGAFLTATLRYAKDALDKLIIILGNK